MIRPRHLIVDFRLSVGLFVEFTSTRVCLSFLDWIMFISPPGIPDWLFFFVWLVLRLDYLRKRTNQPHGKRTRSCCQNHWQQLRVIQLQSGSIRTFSLQPARITYLVRSVQVCLRWTLWIRLLKWPLYSYRSRWLTVHQLLPEHICFQYNRLRSGYPKHP